MNRINKFYYAILLTSYYIILCDCFPRWASKEMFCKNGNDCPPNYCCVLGFTRYSIPKCVSFGEIGSWCRSYNEPENKTLSYPNGEYQEFSNIYTQFCPCMQGLTCTNAKCTQFSHNDFENSLFDDI